MLSVSLWLPRLSPLSTLAVVSSYTNMYVPLARLRAEVLAPLLQEREGLQAFRQPTQVTSCSPSLVNSQLQEELSKAGPQCPVCLDVMHVGRVTPCGHVFHSHCLRRCLASSNTCPYCRAPIV